MIWVWFLLVVALTTAVLLVSRRLGRTQLRLAGIESRLAAVLAASDTGLSVWDSAGHLVGFNKRFKEFYPNVPLKPGVVFEDLIRHTANRGLVQVAGDDVDGWVSEWVDRYGTTARDVWRTPDGRWVDVHTRVADSGEVLLLYTDMTDTREHESTLTGRNQQLERRSSALGLLADIVHVATAAPPPPSAAERIVELVCSWSGWSVGYVHSVTTLGDGDVGTRDLMASWYADASRYADLRVQVETATGHDGGGVADRACRTRRTVWVPNVSVDPTTDPERRALMTASGLRGVCAVPVASGDRVVAVLEFLSSDQLTPDPTTNRLLEATAEILASVLTTRNDA